MIPGDTQGYDTPLRTPLEKWLAKALPADPSKPTRGHVLAAMARGSRLNAYATKDEKGWTPFRRYPADWEKGDPLPLPVPLSSWEFADHLKGQRRIGVYLLPEGACVVGFGLIDLDDHKGTLGWPEILARARRIAAILDADGIAYRAVKSGGGKGIHLIPIWKTPQPARDVRYYLEEVVKRAGMTVAAKADGIEVFPKQDTVGVGHFGSLVSLPYWKDTGDIDLATGEKLAEIPPLVLNEKVLPTAPAPAPRRPTTEIHDVDLLELQSALEAIPNGENGTESLEYENSDSTGWIHVGMAIVDASGKSDEGCELWHEFSAKSPKYDQEKTQEKWESFEAGKAGGVTARTAYKMAYAAGWKGFRPGASAADFDDLAADDPDDPVIPFADDPGDPEIPREAPERSNYNKALIQAKAMTQEGLEKFLANVACHERDGNFTMAQSEEILKGVKERLGTSLAVLREMLADARRKNRQAPAGDGEDRWATQHGLGEVLAFVANKGAPLYVFLEDHRAGAKGSAWKKRALEECLSPLNTVEEQADGNMKEKPCFELWCKDPSRVELSEMVFRPDLPPLAVTPEGGWNVFQGFVTQPREDTAKAQEWFDFVDLFFSPGPGATSAQREENAELKRKFIQWCAHAFQHPHIRQITSWTFTSEHQGLGKSAIPESLAWTMGLGRGGCIVGEGAVTSEWTQFLEGALLVVVNELQSADKHVQRKLNNLRTLDTININVKGGGNYNIANLASWSFTTNGLTAFTIEAEARRDWVFTPRPSPELRTKAVDFARKFCGNVGRNGEEGVAFSLPYRAALLYALQQVDLSDYDPNAPAGASTAKGAAAQASKTAEELTVEECAEKILLELGDKDAVAWTYPAFENWWGGNRNLDTYQGRMKKLRDAVTLRLQKIAPWLQCGEDKFRLHEGDESPQRMWYVSKTAWDFLQAPDKRKFLHDGSGFTDLSSAQENAVRH